MNVLIAADDQTTCQEIQSLLDPQLDITAHTCVDACDLRRHVRATRPDLVLLDWELTGRPPAALLFALDRVSCSPASRQTTGHWPTGYWPAVIVLSNCPEVKPVALACGAAAFVHKHQAHATLDTAVRRLAADPLNACPVPCLA